MCLKTQNHCLNFRFWIDLYEEKASTKYYPAPGVELEEKGFMYSLLNKQMNLSVLRTPTFLFDRLD